jgi:hypothetical protein
LQPPSLDASCQEVLVSQLRRDVHVPNESDAFVFTSAGQRGRGLMPGEAAWNAAVASCQVLPLLVESEDRANMCVVVGGQLDAAELAEWVGRVGSGLRIPDGRLALCGGAAYVLTGVLASLRWRVSAPGPRPRAARLTRHL